MGLALCCYPFLPGIRYSPLRCISGVLGIPCRVSMWAPRLEQFHLAVSVMFVLRSFVLLLATENGVCPNMRLKLWQRGRRVVTRVAPVIHLVD